MCAAACRGAWRTQKSVGIRGLNPRISTIAIPYRGGSRKHTVGSGSSKLPAEAVGRQSDFGLFQSVKREVWTGGCLVRPARRFAFGRSEERIEDLIPGFGL